MGAVKQRQINEKRKTLKIESPRPVFGKDLDPNEKIFELSKLEDVKNLKELLEDNFTIFIKILCFLAPEQVFEMVDLDSLPI